MNTPIIDFVHRYIDKNTLRLHMPGHKGSCHLGFEHLDITEVHGADSLYEAEGIIAESEANASSLFGCRTLYSTEGSSLCIRAMVHLLSLHARAEGKKPRILAGRNAHKTFLSAVALLDVDVEWMFPPLGGSYLSCPVEACDLDKRLTASAEKPTAVYLTSPDYPGNTVDIAAIAEVCHRHGVLLAVDNAHGAYLKFLPVSRHPMDLGADICCDSAHKTLPTLTGGAYLHLADSAPTLMHEQAKNALALFGSTSPSYLILQSLDYTNFVLAEGDFPARLAKAAENVQELRRRLSDAGYVLVGDEPMKLTLSTKSYGYEGTHVASHLRKHNIECEFADPDFVVLMPAPEPQLSVKMLERVVTVLCSLPKKEPVCATPPLFRGAEAIMSVREATMSPSEIIPAAQSEGRILAVANVGCPPAVPIVVCGERIDKHAVDCFAYYGIESCNVVQ